jgi:hypothetical protein
MPSPFDSHLSALAQANSLAKMHRIAGLDQSVASMLRDVNALTAHGGLERLRQQTESILGTKDYLLREARKIASAIEDAEQVRKRYASFFSDAFGDMERYRRMVSDAIGPLSALRSVALYESEAARLAMQSGGLLGAAGVKSYAEAFSATEQIRKQQELLATNLGEPLAGRWLSSARDIAQQFASARDIIDKQAKAWRDATAFDPAQLARGLGMPVMDAASFAAIARSSGVEGLLAQLKSFGIDEATLRAVASTVAEDEDDVEELLRDSGETDGAPRRQLTKAQLVRLWNIVFILYSVLFPLYTWWDSNQAEARITGEIKAAEARTSAEIGASEQRTSEKLGAMAKLMERVVEIAEQEVLAETNMVVRERVATIRADPRHGAGVVAEAFPNQVVTLLEERGKWIKVEYYDWLARDERTGWALKKYFARAEPAFRASRGHRLGSSDQRQNAGGANKEAPATAGQGDAGSVFVAEAEQTLERRGVGDRGTHPLLLIDKPITKEEAKARIRAIKALAREGKLR